MNLAAIWTHDVIGQSANYQILRSASKQGRAKCLWAMQSEMTRKEFRKYSRRCQELALDL
jgi:hypothetical protein